MGLYILNCKRWWLPRDMTELLPSMAIFWGTQWIQWMIVFKGRNYLKQFLMSQAAWRIKSGFFGLTVGQTQQLYGNHLSCWAAWPCARKNQMHIWHIPEQKHNAILAKSTSNFVLSPNMVHFFCSMFFTKKIHQNHLDEVLHSDPLQGPAMITKMS